MKQNNIKQHSPRLKHAISVAVISFRDSCGWYGYRHFHDDLGKLIYLIAYKADKYDVLNKLALPGNYREIVTFCRGDIRKRVSVYDIFNKVLLLMLVIYFIEGLIT